MVLAPTPTQHASALAWLAGASLLAATTRVVDAETGEPVAGAVVYRIDERDVPLSGERWHAQRVEADETGLVALDDPPGDHWYLAEAPGYAPAAEHAASPPERFELARGVDATLLAVDVFGEPVADLSIGWMLGCGHTPDVRNAVTDAEGRATLHDFDASRGDLWPVGEGVLSDYVNVAWSGDGRSGVVSCAPGRTLVGRILDADGEPLSNVFVGQPNRHRGPWTAVGADGSFRLTGIDDGRVQVRSASGDRLAESVGVVPGAGPLVLRVGTAEPELHEVRVTCTLDGAVTGSVRVAAVPDGERPRRRERTNDWGTATFRLPAEPCTLFVGSALGPYDAEPVRIRPGAVTEVEVALTRRPALPVVAADLPEGARVWLATAVAQRQITRELGQEVTIPAERSVLRVFVDGQQRRHEITDAERGAGKPLELRWDELAPMPTPADVR